jgi:hypothetical protein
MLLFSQKLPPFLVRFSVAPSNFCPIFTSIRFFSGYENDGAVSDDKGHHNFTGDNGDDSKKLEDPTKLKEIIKKEEKELIYKKEFILIEECFNQKLTDIDPQSGKRKTKALSKAQLQTLCIKLELENECQKSTGKKFQSLTRIALSDFLISKIQRRKELADRKTRDIYWILDNKK